MTVRFTRFALVAPLLSLGACMPDIGAPDLSRGSADSPMTMLVDQMNNGVPAQSGTQVMTGATAQQRGAAYRGDFGRGGAAPVITPQGGEKR